MKKNVEVTLGALKCDNPKCDFRDDSVKVENYSEWINKPCPKCNENLLTEEDFRNSEKLLMVAHFLNSLTKDEFESLKTNPSLATIETLKQTEMFKNAEGIEHLRGDEAKGTKIKITIDTHKKITVSKIEKDDTTNS